MRDYLPNYPRIADIWTAIKNKSLTIREHYYHLAAQISNTRPDCKFNYFAYKSHNVLCSEVLHFLQFWSQQKFVLLLKFKQIISELTNFFGLLILARIFVQFVLHFQFLHIFENIKNLWLIVFRNQFDIHLWFTSNVILSELVLFTLCFIGDCERKLNDSCKFSWILIIKHSTYRRVEREAGSVLVDNFKSNIWRFLCYKISNIQSQ